MKKTYGLTRNDLDFVQNKMDNQRSYLKNNFIQTQSGQVKSLMDLSFSANHSVRYYAQLANKINTMTDYAQTIGHKGIFLTMTLDGFFRDLHKGDYSRFDKLSDEKMEVVRKSIPKSDALGDVLSKVDSKLPLSIKDLYNILNHQTKNFFKSYAFKKLRKSGVKYSYIRTAEPHSDGIPHFHMMLYIPDSHIESVKKDFIKSFPAPQNSKKIKFSDDLQGFQTDVNNASAYIMKYITKSFLDVKKDVDMDYLQAWYIKHRIMRSVTSHSTVPQWVYQKAMPLEKDWFYLTEILNDVNSQAEWSKEDDYFCFIDYHTDRELIYDRGVYKIMYHDRVIKEFGETKEKKKKYDEYEKVPNLWTSPHKNVFNSFDVVMDDVSLGKHHIINNQIVKPKKQPHQMKDLELYDYFHSIDIDTIDLNHYIYTRNMMINRGLLQAEPMTQDEYKSEEFELISPYTSSATVIQSMEVF